MATQIVKRTHFCVCVFGGGVQRRRRVVLSLSVVVARGGTDDGEYLLPVKL